MLHRLHTAIRLLQQYLQHSGLASHPRGVASISAGVLATVVALWLWARSRRPGAEELERRRREWLAATGRLRDGLLLDARTLAGEESHAVFPEVLFYRYRIAGVTYDCAQDVSQLPDQTAGYRLDQPVQVRYDPRNPGNSIIVSQGWSGVKW